MSKGLTKADWELFHDSLIMRYCLLVLPLLFLAMTGLQPADAPKPASAPVPGDRDG